MFAYFENRRKRKYKERLQKLTAKREAENRLEKDLIERGKELKETLIKAGIHPFSRINRNLEDEYIFMFGILNGRLVRADMGRKGYFLIKYMEDK